MTGPPFSVNWAFLPRTNVPDPPGPAKAAEQAAGGFVEAEPDIAGGLVCPHQAIVHGMVGRVAPGPRLVDRAENRPQRVGVDVVVDADAIDVERAVAAS